MTSVAGAHLSLYTKEKVYMSFDLIREFSTTFQVASRTTGAVRVPEAKLRFGLIKEEFDELLTALDECDVVETADALGDIEYVVIGAAHVFGVLDPMEQHLEALAEAGLDNPGENPIFSVEGHKEILTALRDGILTNDVASVSHTLSTTLYLVREGAKLLSINLEEVVKAIHRSNMTKLDANGQPIFRESDRKIMKGESYKAPTEDIERILFEETDADAGE